MAAESCAAVAAGLVGDEARPASCAATAGGEVSDAAERLVGADGVQVDAGRGVAKDGATDAAKEVVIVDEGGVTVGAEDDLPGNVEFVADAAEPAVGCAAAAVAVTGGHLQLALAPPAAATEFHKPAGEAAERDAGSLAAGAAEH